jgi:hypothetical protein
MNSRPKHFKLDVSKMIAKAAKLEFSITWDPRVIRHAKDIGDSTLDYIDYATPCFELSKLVSAPPNEISARLAKRLQTIDNNEFIFSVESLGGYLNFMVHEDSLKSALSEAFNWFASPHKLPVESLDIEFLVAGISSSSDSGQITITDLAYEYLGQIFKIIGIPIHSTNLVSDFSHDVSSDLCMRISDHRQSSGVEVNRLSVNREIKNYLKDIKPSAGELYEEISSVVEGDWMQKRIMSEYEANIVSRTILHESEISEKVHKYIDASSTLQKDKGSRAVWTDLGSDTIALRSATGVLYTNAYLLYLLENSYKYLKTQNGKRMIVVGSLGLSLIISEQIRSLIKRADENIMVYFDPGSSRASILEITSMAPSFADLLGSLSNALREESIPGLITNPNTRRSLITLSDFPQELLELSAANQYPSIFEAVSQVCYAKQDLFG